MSSVNPHRLRGSLALTVLAFAAACTDRIAAPKAPPPSEPTLAQGAARENRAMCDADNGGLILPANFCAAVIARDVGIARHIVARPNGDIYVALDNSRDGTITGAVLAYHNEQLWFAPRDRVLRFTFSGNELVPSAAPDVIAGNLPADADHLPSSSMEPAGCT